MDENKIDYIPCGGVPINENNEYPPNSPDMNPIENVFGYWQSQILHQNPQNMEELITVCRK